MKNQPEVGRSLAELFDDLQRGRTPVNGDRQGPAGEGIRNEG